MPAPLLFIGHDEVVRVDLMDIEGEVVRTPTIEAARWYLLRDPDAAGRLHVIAYGVDVAREYEGDTTGLVAPLPLAVYGPAVILHHDAPGALPFGRAAVRRLHACRVLDLDRADDWTYLRAQLNTVNTTRTP